MTEATLAKLKDLTSRTSQYGAYNPYPEAVQDEIEALMSKIDEEELEEIRKIK